MGTFERMVRLENEGLDKGGYRSYYCTHRAQSIRRRSLDYGLATLS